jgi:hypothetical protein
MAYRAPFPSWASVRNTAGITPELHNKGVVCKILAVDVDPNIDHLGKT